MVKKATGPVISVSVGDKKFIFPMSEIEVLPVRLFMPGCESKLKKLDNIWGMGNAFTVRQMLDTPLDLIQHQAPDCVLLLAILMRRMNRWFSARRNLARTNPDWLLEGKSEEDCNWNEKNFVLAVNHLITKGKLVPKVPEAPEEKTFKEAVIHTHRVPKKVRHCIITAIIGNDNEPAMKVFKGERIFDSQHLAERTLEWLLSLEGISSLRKNGILRRMIDRNIAFSGSSIEEMQTEADKLPANKQCKFGPNYARVKSCDSFH